jgi:hypothetical protein
MDLWTKPGIGPVTQPRRRVAVRILRPPVPRKGKASAGGWDRAFGRSDSSDLRRGELVTSRRSDVHHEAAKGRGMTHRNGRRRSGRSCLWWSTMARRCSRRPYWGDDDEPYRCGANDPTPPLHVGDELQAVSLVRYRRTVARPMVPGLGTFIWLALDRTWQSRGSERCVRLSSTDTSLPELVGFTTPAAVVLFAACRPLWSWLEPGG